jgi:uncharacterized protein YbjT (DUF2867 family)
MTGTILVLSANSKVGAEALRLLREAGAEVRAGARNLAKVEAPRAVHADLDKPETLEEAMRGVSKVLLATSADGNQVTQHHAAIEAAKKAGVRHVVRVSVVGADLGSPLRIGRMHAESEKELEASGMAWTHLRPQSFMQNLLAMAPMIQQGQLFGCTGEGKFPLVDVRDIAAVAVAALLEEGHEGRAYEVTGPEALSQGEQAAVLSRVLERPVVYIDVPAEAVRGGMVQAGLPEWLASDLTFLYANVVAKGHASAVSPDVERVLGRPGIRFEQFARDHRAVFVPAPAAGAS